MPRDAVAGSANATFAAAAEGIGMERCPHCGTPGRPGAKFCTTCGYEFVSGASGAEAGESSDAASPAPEEVQTTGDSGADAGWPSAPTDAANGDNLWAPAREIGPTAVSEDDEDERVANPWTATGANTWPSGPSASDGAPDAEQPAIAVAMPPEPAPVAETADAVDVDAVDASDARIRAEGLLDELRAVITSMSDAEIDLDGVISDLEVALEPPGVLRGEGLTELREALLNARERPRDVDTLVDMTHRVDAVMALMIGYDRAIAAIERSLNALRRT
jgi:hypothetical protein